MIEEIDDELALQLSDDAYIEACELVGPNAPGFDALQEQIYEGLLIKHALLKK